jgi:hypothetical protein
MGRAPDGWNDAREPLYEGSPAMAPLSDFID